MNDEIPFLSNPQERVDAVVRQREVAQNQAANWEAIARTEHSRRVLLEKELDDLKSKFEELKKEVTGDVSQVETADSSVASG